MMPLKMSELWRNSVLEEHKQLCEFSADYVLESVEFYARVKKNLPSLQILINLKVVSAGIARGDLSFRHLEVVFRRDGQHCLSTLLVESVSGKIRVSRSKKNDCISMWLLFREKLDAFTCSSKNLYREYYIIMYHMFIDWRVNFFVIHI